MVKKAPGYSITGHFVAGHVVTGRFIGLILSWVISTRVILSLGYFVVGPFRHGSFCREP
jgi:hypothetical protein